MACLEFNKPGSQTCKLKDDSLEMVSFGWLQQPDGSCCERETGGGWQRGEQFLFRLLPSPYSKPPTPCQAWAAPHRSVEAAGGDLCQGDARVPRDRALQTL